jgi:hypothetical protein
VNWLVGKLTIAAGSVQATATLNDSTTAKAIWDALPIDARGSTWGDEIYFSIPVHVPEDDARAVVELGAIAYWPPGNAFCIFFGPTPASLGSECRAASPVNVVGAIDGDASAFKQVRSGARVTLRKAD